MGVETLVREWSEAEREMYALLGQKPEKGGTEPADWSPEYARYIEQFGAVASREYGLRQQLHAWAESHPAKEAA